MFFANLYTMNGKDIQQSLFRQIKERLPAHLSLSEDLAALLGVSNDSAYRRIRGEKVLDINEFETICRHYKVSADSLFQQNTDGYVFRGRFANDETFDFKAWMASILGNLDLAMSGAVPEFIFQAKDLPIFHHFQLPELAMFKYFFWRKTIMQEKGYERRLFSHKDRDEQLVALGKKVYLAYNRIPSIEIWNAECINSTLNQIGFYRESGVFESEEDAQVLYDQLLLQLQHIEHEVEAGCKFSVGDTPVPGMAAYKVFVNEVMMGDNAIYVNNGLQRLVYLNHSGINYIATTDDNFCDNTLLTFNNIMKKSMLISGVGEKERNRFFKSLRDEIDLRRKS